MNTQALEGGFAQPAPDAAYAFRALLSAMARPGRIEEISGGQGPAPLSPAAASVLLTLCDATTPLHLAGAYDCEEIRSWVAFHTGAPVCGPETATFALGDWADLVPLERFSRGSPEYPDRSATLIVELPQLRQVGATLRGPGIAQEAHLSLPEIRAFQDNRAAFPLGLDFLFTSGGRVAALPRSTEVR